MLKRIRQKLAKRMTAKRRQPARLRPLLERLEDRAMLSASHAQLAQNHGQGKPEFAGNGGAKHYFESAVYSTGPQQAAFDSQSGRGGKGGGNSNPGFNDGPLMPPAFPRNDMHAFDGGLSNYPALNPQFASPPPPTSTLNTYAPPLLQRSHSGPTTPIAIAPVLPKLEPRFSDPLWNNNVWSPSQIILRETRVSITTLIIFHQFVNPPLTNTHTNPNITANGSLPNFLDTPANVIPSATGVLAYASTLTDPSVIQQITARDAGSIAALSAIARDLVFQDYAPQLLLMAANSSYDHGNVGMVSSKAAQSEVLEGFLLPSDQSQISEVADPKDAVAREREAVDAVLDELRDVDSVPATQNDVASSVDNTSGDQSADMKVDLEFEAIAADELPAGEVDGGMVLLQSTGDVNESAFDLAPVYAEQLKNVVVKAGMETSIGWYQAMDVAVDENTSAEAAEPADLIVEPQADMRLDKALPVNHEATTSNRAAAALGATALTGALVWFSRNRSASRQTDDTAQKRRAHRA
jgi:hypothetical protein